MILNLSRIYSSTTNVSHQQVSRGYSWAESDTNEELQNMNKLMQEIHLKASAKHPVINSAGLVRNGSSWNKDIKECVDPYST